MRASKRVRDEAVRLRRSGLSYSEIQRRLPKDVSKGTLSGWLSSIKMSASKRRQMLKRTSNHGTAALAAFKNKCKANRHKLFTKAKSIFSDITVDRNSLLLIGAALYWAEGTKKQVFAFTNSDPVMIRFFLRWLRDGLGVPDSHLSFSIHTYLDAGKSLADIEAHWCKVTGFKKTYFQKAMINKVPRNSKQTKVGKSTYGTLHIRLRHSLAYHAILAALLEKFGKPSMFVEKSIFK